jgi:hypothetical protein
MTNEVYLEKLSILSAKIDTINRHRKRKVHARERDREKKLKEIQKGSSVVLLHLLGVKAPGLEDPDEGLILHAALDELLAGQLAVPVNVQLHKDPAANVKKVWK